MSRIIQDLRYALRTLRKKPGLTAVIVLSLAIGIGANTAIFSVVDALLLKPLPYPNPDRLAVLWLRSPGIGIPQDWPSPGQYIDLQTQNHSFEEMSISQGRQWTLTGLERPERIEGITTSSSLFRLLGAKPLLGRLILPEDDVPGRPAIAVLSNALWHRLFNSDPHIIGRGITLNATPYTVVGVLPANFLLNAEVMPTVSSIEKMEIFLPLPLGADAVKRRGDENYNLMARLKPGVTVAQAQADVDVIASRIRTLDKRDRTFTISVVGLLDQVVGNVRRALLVLLGSVSLVLLIACANVANLLLLRASSRQKEVAIRTALGAGWRELVRQLLTESILLGILGGAAGLLIANWGLYVVRTVNPGNIPRLETIGIDGGVLAFTFGISVLSGIVFGVAPALRAAKVDLNTTLKSGGRNTQAEGGLGSSRNRLRSLLVVSELALSLILLAGAGLLIRSFVSLQSVSPGFNPSHVISMQVSLNAPRPARMQAYQQILQRIARLPGVQADGTITALPLTSSVGWGGINIEGFTPQPGQEVQADFRVASPDYFRAMQIPLLKGRYFDDHDAADSQQVVIVDQKFADRFWPNQNPIGKHVWNDPKKPITVVGVVGIVKQYGLDTDGKIVSYYPPSQVSVGSNYLVARTSSAPEAMSTAIIREIHAVDASAPVYGVRTMEDRLHDSLARQRFSAIMLGAFALFALILASVGVYGVISYLVTQGTHDIGIRIALGAPRSGILRLIVRQGMELAGMGIAAGLIGALLLTRLMSSLLFGVSATDFLTFTAVALVLASVALLASFIPARRATRLDPLAALRDE
ncbi:MAG TPA: ABC transporter permease [Candidatus Sulfopaludibacter sp.]|jgi:predicted permease|nr:ABC transporter permease [Candidatus Sulfopaludibacter sp.]